MRARAHGVFPSGDVDRSGKGANRLRSIVSLGTALEDVVWVERFRSAIVVDDVPTP